MAVTPNTTTSTDIIITARKLDFVTQFAHEWQALRDITGIMRPIKKEPGTTLRSYVTTVNLTSGIVAEGDEIPLSKAQMTEVAKADLTFHKYDKRITLETVDKYGASVAVYQTDEEMRNAITSEILDDFYDFAKTGTLKSTEADFQMAVAMAIGRVRDKFKKMRRTATKIAVFVNTLDAYAYLGKANIISQTEFGLEYINNFMGASTFILSSEIDRGQVIATPVNNIVLYYADMSNSDYKQLGLDYTVDGETNLIGFHTEPVYNRAAGDTYAVYALKLWAEYLDGIAVITFGDTTPSEDEKDEDDGEVETQSANIPLAQTVAAKTTATKTTAAKTTAKE